MKDSIVQGTEKPTPENSTYIAELRKLVERGEMTEEEYKYNYKRFCGIWPKRGHDKIYSGIYDKKKRDYLNLDKQPFYYGTETLSTGYATNEEFNFLGLPMPV